MKSKKFYIQVNKPSDFDRIFDYAGKSIPLLFEIEAERKSFEEVEKIFDNLGKIKFDGFVLGTEFCEHLSFSVLEIIKQITEIVDQEFEIVINTTILSSVNENIYMLLFSFLKEKEIKAKIVINDIGHLEIIKEIGFKPDEIIVGRLLSRQKKIFEKIVSEKLKESTIDFSEYRSFFQKNGVNFFEYDILPQGNNIENYNDKYLLFPWGYHTSSRACVTKSYLSKKNFVFPMKKCDMPCISTYIDFEKNSEAIQKGNTVFYNSLKYIEAEEFNKFNNYIYQPYLPN